MAADSPGSWRGVRRLFAIIFWQVAAVYAITAFALRLVQPTTSFPFIVEEKNEI